MGVHGGPKGRDATIFAFGRKGGRLDGGLPSHHGWEGKRGRPGPMEVVNRGVRVSKRQCRALQKRVPEGGAGEADEGRPGGQPGRRAGVAAGAVQPPRRPAEGGLARPRGAPLAPLYERQQGGGGARQRLVALDGGVGGWWGARGGRGAGVGWERGRRWVGMASSCQLYGGGGGPALIRVRRRRRDDGRNKSVILGVLLLSRLSRQQVLFC